MIVESESNSYRLHVTGYHGDSDDAFNDYRWAYNRSNGMPFSTPDVDNDQLPVGNCALGKKCGWWFNRCSTSFLTGVGGGYWFTGPVSSSRMMLQCGAG